jgi:hypothetical protein
VDWLAGLYCTKSGWRCIGRFFPAKEQNLHNPPAIEKQGSIPEEMSQTKYTHLTLLSQHKLAFTTRNTLFARYTIISMSSKAKSIS